MNKIKAIISDFDGTLVDKNEKVTPGVKTLIKKIQDKGIRISIATGRLYSNGVKRVEDELNIRGIHIFHGGAKIYNTANEKTLLLQPISKESAINIYKYLKLKNVFLAFETEKDVFMYPKALKVSYLKNVEARDIYDLKDYKRILKILIFAKLNYFNEKQLDLHTKNIQKTCKDIEIIKFNFEGNFGVDITSEKSTKHTAVLEYCKMLNYKQENIVAIGDGYNDFHLFTASGFKIAMGGSPKELKDFADLVVPTVEDGGMEVALQYIYDKLL